MSVVFATCDVNRAVGFIRKMYPSQEVTREKMPLLVGLIRRDVLRVQDPEFHQPCRIIAGTNYDDTTAHEVDAAIREFTTNVHNAPVSGGVKS